MNLSLSLSLAQQVLPAAVAATLAIVSPAAAWDGTEGSGFTTTPSDPTRTTAKPACRLITPERQWFTDTLDVGVAAAANNKGSLANLGLEKVIFHFEGGSVEVSAPGYNTIQTTAGERTYMGWWARLQKPSGTNGFGHLYIEAVPADSSMQSRIIGPYTFGLNTSEHDFTVDIAPSQAEVAGSSYQTLNAAVAYLKTQNAENPLMRLTEAGDYDLVDASPSRWNVRGFYTIEGIATGAQIARADPNPYTSDADLILIPPRVPLRFKDLTIELSYISEIRAGSVEGHHWVDGCTINNARGLNHTRRGEVPNTFGSIIRDNAWFTECSIRDVHVPFVGASLVRGCDGIGMGQDMCSNSRCVVHSTFTAHDNSYFNIDYNAFTATYTGVEATATLERTGGTEGNGGGEYVATYGATEARFEVAGNGPSSDYFDGTLGDGYWFSDVVDWLNGLPGWTAVLQDDTFKASTGSLAGVGGSGFAPQNVKDTVLQVMSHTDKHGDWYQHSSNTQENIIIYNNRVWDAQAQMIFLSPIGGADENDYVFFNNAFARSALTVNLSQFGRTNVAQSHIVVAHCTFSNQGIRFRTDNTGYTLDSYCLFSNISCRDIGWASGAAADPNVIIDKIHQWTGEPTPDRATNVTSGGDDSTLYLNSAIGNFTPAGDLLTNLSAPVFPLDLDGETRASTDAVGALKVP